MCGTLIGANPARRKPRKQLEMPEMGPPFSRKSWTACSRILPCNGPPQLPSPEPIPSCWRPHRRIVPRSQRHNSSGVEKADARHGGSKRSQKAAFSAHCFGLRGHLSYPMDLCRTAIHPQSSRSIPAHLPYLNFFAPKCDPEHPKFDKSTLPGNEEMDENTRM